MNVRDIVVCGKLRMLLRMYEDDPNLILKEAQLSDVLTADDLSSVTAKAAGLMAERLQLSASIGALSARAQGWNNKRADLITLKQKFLKATERKRIRGKLTAPWFYKETSKLEDKAAVLAHEFAELPDSDQQGFVTKSHPHYRKPKDETASNFQVALPYPRYGYEHREELHNIHRTAHMTIIADAMKRLER